MKKANKLPMPWFIDLLKKDQEMFSLITSKHWEQNYTIMTSTTKPGVEMS